MSGSLKWRLARASERHLVNPVVGRLVQAGRMGRTYAVLETTGRRTGRPRRIPVANGLRDNAFWLISAHGPRALYFQNLRADPRVRIGLADHGAVHWRTGTAHPMPNDDARARHRQLGRGRLGYRLDGLLLRALATDLTTVRVDLHNEP